MLLALGILFGFAVFFWLVFFQFKWLKPSVPWVLVSAFFVVHVLLIFLIGLRFMTPASNNAKVVQHTIQLVPRLTEPTLVTAVLVAENQPVRRDLVSLVPLPWRTASALVFRDPQRGQSLSIMCSLH